MPAWDSPCLDGGLVCPLGISGPVQVRDMGGMSKAGQVTARDGEARVHVPRPASQPAAPEPWHGMFLGGAGDSSQAKALRSLALYGEHLRVERLGKETVPGSSHTQRWKPAPMGATSCVASLWLNPKEQELCGDHQLGLNLRPGFVLGPSDTPGEALRWLSESTLLSLPGHSCHAEL